MILDGCHFQYGDFNSREYGLIFAHCDTSSYDRLMGEVSASTSFNKRNRVQYILNDSFEDSPISFEAEVVADNFIAIPLQKRRTIEKMLFNKPDYRKLYVDIDDDIMADTYEYVNGYLKRLYFNCRFMNPSKIEDGNGLVVGYRFTIECDSCMAWQEATEREYDVSASTNSIITVDADTDIGGYTYPKVTIQVGSTGGTITITNNSDDYSRLTKFVNLSPSVSLVMRGDINYISGQNYEKFSNQNFIRLLDGDNNFGIIGDVESIKFEWNNRRFI